VTNWITAAGLALIAGGIAVLIGFRHALLGREPSAAAGPRAGSAPSRSGLRERGVRAHAGRADFSAPGQLRARRRRQALTAAAPAAVALAVAPPPIAPPAPPEPLEAPPVLPEADPESGDDVPETTGRRARRRARRRDDAPDDLGAEPAGADDDEGPGGLAALGLADDEPVVPVEAVPEPEEPAADVVAEAGFEAGAEDAGDESPAVDFGFRDDDADDEPATGTLAALGMAPAVESEPVPVPRRDGDRIAGWVRPLYDDEPVAGEYWTPVPETLQPPASYGWPVPVERLPEVPPYPPQSGFDPYDQDVDAAAEPTRAVPQWPPAKPSGRIELPRSWASRNQQPRSGEDGEADRPRRRSPVRRRVPNPDTQALPAVTDTEQSRRPRPRPRPGPSDRSNVYRSRHAADPG
jgi:hypothetical protein